MLKIQIWNFIIKKKLIKCLSNYCNINELDDNDMTPLNYAEQIIDDKKRIELINFLKNIQPKYKKIPFEKSNNINANNINSTYSKLYKFYL